MSSFDFEGQSELIRLDGPVLEGDGAHDRSQPLVSICMPVSRKPALTRRALTSVLAQDFADFEILIGDETGESAGVVAALADDRVRYTRNASRLGSALNHRSLL